MSGSLQRSRLLSLICLLAAIATGCNNNDDMSVNCAASGPAISVASTTSPTCKATGSITVASVGGQEPLTYSIEADVFQEESEFAGLEPGAYTITVMDANKCTATTSVVLTTQNDLSLTYEATVAGCGPGSAGNLTLAGAGGSGQYSFSLDGGPFTEAASFEGISNGEHTIKMADGFCDMEATVIVPSGISFETDISPIINNRCAVGVCHVTGERFPDFTKFTNIKGNASHIKERVSKKEMPPLGADNPDAVALTDDEIQKIVCWVDDGAPEN